MPTTRRIKIRHHSYEADCDECGCPLDVGDTATYQSDPTYRGDDPDGDLVGPVFCGSGCASSFIGRVERDSVVPRY